MQCNRYFLLSRKINNNIFYRLSTFHKLYYKYISFVSSTFYYIYIYIYYLIIISNFSNSLSLSHLTTSTSPLYIRLERKIRKYMKTFEDRFWTIFSSQKWRKNVIVLHVQYFIEIVKIFESSELASSFALSS